MLIFADDDIFIYVFALFFFFLLRHVMIRYVIAASFFRCFSL